MDDLELRIVFESDLKSNKSLGSRFGLFEHYLTDFFKNTNEISNAYNRNPKYDNNFFFNLS